MPIMLDDIDLNISSTKTKKVDAKFFSSKLTGNGKKTGLLNESLIPINTTTNTAYAADARIEVKQSSTQQDLTTTQVPITPIMRRSLESGNTGTFTIPVGPHDERFIIDTNNSTVDVSFDMTPQALTLYENTTTGSRSRELVIQYRMELYFLGVGVDEPERVALQQTSLGGPFASVDWDTSPVENAEAFIATTLQKLGVTALNLDDLGAWMEDYPIYERITRQAEIWTSEKIADEINAYVGDLAASVAAAQKSTPSKDQLNLLAYQLRYLENYNVPLEAYARIHKNLEHAFSEAIASTLAKQNLSLLMNHTLAHLDQIKPQLIVPPMPMNPPALQAHYSQQQRAVISTHEPLVMAQAGAGAGKTTTIGGRIAYLEACGVDPADITVLSFTNAAADNVKERFPQVGSMTIARMLIDIYQMSHPRHQISGNDTIMNSIDIYFPTSGFAAEFRARLLAMDQGKVGAMTVLNTFVENHYENVMQILDTIGQTSLELQIIICYQKIDQMPEPAHVQSKYLIVDEVQDTSVFEFIYLLKYVTKHEQSMFIVGDASQTLYEFRSANPRALNTLEGSGVFETFRLSTNYRSNQEILDFANVTLGGLETNQFANIRLQANSLDVPTADSFQEKVTLDYQEMARIGTFVSDTLEPIMQNTVIPNYVDKCLEKGEQVAFLAFSRREVAAMQSVLEQRYPDKHVASLVADRIYGTDIFSKYIKNFWNDVMQAQPQNATFVITTDIRQNKIDKLAKNASDPKTAKAITTMVLDWYTQSDTTVKGWLALVNQKAMTHAEFFENLKQNMLAYEIRRTQQKLNVNRQKNEERKKKNMESKADLIVSTIHGAKGLEFDNVVALYKENTTMSQIDKRMFYVAFTRAMHSEYVLAYGSVKNPPIQSGYDAIVAALTERDRKNTLRAQGIDPDAQDDNDQTDDRTPAVA